MTDTRSLAVLDDRPILVDGIVRVAQFTYPDLEVSAGSAATRAAVRTPPAADSPAPGAAEADAHQVVVLGGGTLDSCRDTALLDDLLGTGASLIALIDTRPPTDVYELRDAGVGVFVCVSEGMNELLRGIDRAFAREAHLSPDAEALFSRPARIPPRISPRERQIVMLYLSENDWSVDDVAGLLQISSQTVRSHLARLRSHFTAAGFRVRNRLELRQTLVELGVIDQAPTGPYALPSTPVDARGDSRFRYARDTALAAKVG